MNKRCVFRIVASLLSLSLLIAAHVRAQDTAKAKADFSGEWVNGELSLSINQQGAKLTIITTQKNPQAAMMGLGATDYREQNVFYLDARGETQKSATYKSVTQWEGDRIVTRGSPMIGRDGMSRQVDVSWEIATDRSELMKTSTITSADSKTTTHEIFVPKSLWIAERANIRNEKRPPTTPTFVGRWILDKSKEEGGGPVGEYSLMIEHAAPEIQFKRTLRTKLYRREETLTYYTDGRGEKNIENGHTVESKTKQDGRDVVIRVSSSSRSENDRFDRLETNTWTVSNDGNTLRQKITVNLGSSNALVGLHPPRPVTHTFVRVP